MLYMYYVFKYNLNGLNNVNRSAFKNKNGSFL
jgi:hypothetical protein